jgi:uncharacterized protein (DUF427 family)
MSTRLRHVLTGPLDQLRHEPIQKRIRATVGDTTVVDTTAALLVWEPKRVVPSYAVPTTDVAAEVVGAEPTATGARADDATEAPDAPNPPEGVVPMGFPLDGRRVYDPSIPFSVHTTDGEIVTLRVTGGDARTIEAFRPADPDLASHLLLDFDGFDAWFEEDERNLGHPRDPFHRVEAVHSSRRVRVERNGKVLADSDETVFIFEPPLPVRYYFPLAALTSELLTSSDTITYCAYKGQASYFTVDGEPDLAWGYREPLHDALPVAGRVAFFNERVDVYVDDVLQEQPLTPWSKRD